MKKHIGIVFFFLLSIKLFAQETSTYCQNVQSSLDSMFESLDRTRIPTGLLLDKAVDLVDILKYDGEDLSDSNVVNISIFEEILHSIHASDVSTEQSSITTIIPESYYTPYSSDNVNIAIAFYRYNHIRENALRDNLIIYDDTNDKVYDAYSNGVWNNPYAEKFLFAFTPSSQLSQSHIVSYNFSSLYLFCNSEYDYLMFDAGDGNGYREITTSTNLSVNYSEDGEKLLRLKLHMPNGEELIAHSTLIVSTVNISPCTEDENQMAPDGTITRNYNYNGETVSAKMTYHIASDDNQIRRPFIVVEGFDPWIIEAAFTGADTSGDVVDGDTNYYTFSSNALVYYPHIKDSCDVFYIDWHNSLADIKANSALLRIFIDEINAMKAESGSNEGNIILGQSMGGLVVRHALRSMEIENHDHQVTTFISHDSPHLGANVPMGAQYLIRQLFCLICNYDSSVNLADFFLDNKLSDTQKAIYQVLHSTSAKQMLINYLTPAGSHDNSVHEDWIQELNELGFPQGDNGKNIQNLAIVNGGPFDISSTLVDGSHLLYLNGVLKTSFLTALLAPFATVTLNLTLKQIFPNLNLPLPGVTLAIQGKSNLSIDAVANPSCGFLTPGSLHKASSLKATYTKKFFWIFPKKYVLFDNTSYFSVGTYYFDDAAGSTFTIDSNEGDQITEIVNDTTVLGTLNYRFGMSNKIMFVPSASALAIDSDDKTNFYKNFYLNPPEPNIETPFDAYYLYKNTDEHINLDTKVFNWINIQRRLRINGPDFVSDETKYSYSGYDDTLEWSTSDTQVATIDNNGNLTPTGTGLIDITASKYIDGKLFRTTKKILVGFPDFIIKKRYSTQTGYSFYIRSIDNEAQTLINDLLASGDILIEWTIIDGEGNMSTEISSNQEINYLPRKDESITIAVRLIDNFGNKSSLRSISFNLNTPLSINYKYIVVDSNRNVYFIKNDNSVEVGLPSESFSAIYRNIIMNPNDSAMQVFLKYMKGRDCYLSYPQSDNSISYLKGAAIENGKWNFNYFNQQAFLSELQQSLYYARGPERIIKDLGLKICNTLKEPLQSVPFVIIYKPVFPS